MTCISIYSTKSGKEAMRIRRHVSGGVVSYSWIGKYGAGSGHDYQKMLDTVNLYKRTRRGMHLTEGVEFSETINYVDGV